MLIALAAIVGAMLICFTALIVMGANERAKADETHFAAPVDANGPDKTSMAASERIVGNVGW